MPATSLNFTLGRVASLVFALVLPNCIARLLLPSVWRMKYTITAMIAMVGSTVTITLVQKSGSTVFTL